MRVCPRLARARCSPLKVRCYLWGSRAIPWTDSLLAVLQSIQRDWDFMTDSECIPVHVALSLMDTSTLGKADREPDFLHMYNDIQKTLKAIVNGWFPLEWPYL